MGQFAACERTVIAACSLPMHRTLKSFSIANAVIAVALAGMAHAQTLQKTLPRADQIRPAYGSTWLLLDPCHDFAAEVKQGNIEADVLAEQKQALAALPAGACAKPGMAEKLFQSRFLQQALPVMDSQPWQSWPQIQAQQSRIKACKTLDCLERELDASIARLKPLYLSHEPEAAAGARASLCTSAMQPLPAGKALQMLTAGERKSVLKTAGSVRELQAQTCASKGETLLVLSARMSGNQVNGSEWLYLKSSAAQARQLLFVEDGPLMALPGNCAGKPDLMSSARESAGEHGLSFYRFDGHKYQLMMSFTAESVAADGQVGDWSIARELEYKPLRCIP